MSFQTAPPLPASGPILDFDPSTLPTSHLDSLKFKSTQILESIQNLQRTIEMNGQSYMPPWPEILSKYNVLISQMTNFIVALNPPPSHNQRGEIEAGNMYENIALHPSVPMPDPQLDGELMPLLRTQQTTDVLNMENETVRNLAEHMNTRGSLGVLSGHAPGMQRRPEYSDVLSECEEIRREHDSRVERAYRAVGMLKDKYQWQNWTSVVAEEEPEELEWDPSIKNAPPINALDDDDSMDEDENGQSSEENDEVEGALTSSVQTPADTPDPKTPAELVEPAPTAVG